MDASCGVGAEGGFWAETWKAIARSAVASWLVGAIAWLWRRTHKRKQEATKDTANAETDANRRAPSDDEKKIVVILERWKPGRNGATPVATDPYGTPVNPQSNNMHFHFERRLAGMWVVFQSADRSKAFRYQLPDDPFAGPFVARPPRGSRHGFKK